MMPLNQSFIVLPNTDYICVVLCNGEIETYKTKTQKSLSEEDLNLVEPGVITAVTYAVNEAGFGNWVVEPSTVFVNNALVMTNSSETFYYMLVADRDIWACGTNRGTP